MSTFNTAAGWALAGGIVALGSSIVMSEVFHAERPETMGYVVEGVVEEGGEEAAISFAQAIHDPENPVTAADGEGIFARCASCHTINQGGADGIGPNLYGVMGRPIGSHGGFSYSSALSSVGGNWTFDNMFAWVERPRAFAEGTTMSFAGLSDPYDRAALILYLNEQGSNLPLPDAPAPEAEAEEGEEEAAAEGEEGEAEAAEEEAPVEESAEAETVEG